MNKCTKKVSLKPPHPAEQETSTYGLAANDQLTIQNQLACIRDHLCAKISLLSFQLRCPKRTKLSNQIKVANAPPKLISLSLDKPHPSHIKRDTDTKSTPKHRSTKYKTHNESHSSCDGWKNEMQQNLHSRSEATHQQNEKWGESTIQQSRNPHAAPNLTPRHRGSRSTARNHAQGHRNTRN
jgi:hypothetical protein